MRVLLGFRQFRVGLAEIFLGMVFACGIAWCAGCALLRFAPTPPPPPPPPPSHDRVDLFALWKAVQALKALFWIIGVFLKAMFPFLNN
jgi:hypothetical protein